MAKNKSPSKIFLFLNVNKLLGQFFFGETPKGNEQKPKRLGTKTQLFQNLDLLAFIFVLFFILDVPVFHS